MLNTNQVSAIVSGLAYVNLRTPVNPGGEIRGQIVDDASKPSPNDLLFQYTDYELAVWLMDDVNLSQETLNPSNQQCMRDRRFR